MDEPDDFMIGALLGLTVGALNHVDPQQAPANEQALMRLLSMPPERRTAEAAVLMKALEWEDESAQVNGQGVEQLLAWGLVLRDV